MEKNKIDAINPLAAPSVDRYQRKEWPKIE
jgi:hypothetical protein